MEFINGMFRLFVSSRGGLSFDRGRGRGVFDVPADGIGARVVEANSSYAVYLSTACGWCYEEKLGSREYNRLLAFLEKSGHRLSWVKNNTEC